MGMQFCKNESLTNWAHTEQNNWGNKIPAVNITVLEAYKDGKFEAYLLIDEETNEPINEYFEYEACAVGIDILKLKKKSE